MLGDIRLSVTDVTAHAGDLRAWVEIYAGTRRLTYGDYNLRGPRTVSSMAKACSDAAPTLKTAWLEWLGDCCYDIIHDTLEGDPPIRLAPAKTTPGWIVDRFIGSVGATSLVGFGETGKSMLALAAALTVCSGDNVWLGLDAGLIGPVLFLDWEAGQEQHAWRLHQLCQGVRRDCPDGILYRREGLPLARSVTAVARHVAHNNAALLIVDSVMLARGGDAFGAESTVALYAALGQIGCPTLLVDHRAKHSQDSGDQGPYGSVANLNSARLVWGARTVGVTDGADIRLRRVKANYHGRLEDHAWQLRFGNQNQSARFNRVDAAGVLPGGEATLQDRIVGALQAAGYQGLTAREAAAQAGGSEAVVRATLSKLKARGLAEQSGGRWIAEAQDRQEEAPF